MSQVLRRARWRVSNSGTRTDLCLSVEGIFTDDRIGWYPLLVQRLVVVVALTHRFAQRGAVSLTELGDEEFVALSSEFTLRRLFDRACEQHGLTPKIVFEGSDVATLRGLIAGEIGIGLLPVSLARVMGPPDCQEDGTTVARY